MTAASTPNTEIWDKLKRVPPEHLKGFQRAGGFKGTAIKPMWTIHRMTEIFGPVGTGWGMDEPQFRMEGANVYCTVGVWVSAGEDRRTPNVWGVGGEALTGRGDDEAFKKAYTDALTNALKMLGAGADVHMGLWDGNKYVDEKPAKVTPHEEDPQPSGPQLLKRDEARALYKVLAAELSTLGSFREVSQWEKDKELEIAKLGDWKSYMDKEIEKHLQYIEANTPQTEAAE